MHILFTEPVWKSYGALTQTPIFTPEQCNIIIQEGKSLKREDAEVGGRKKKLDLDVRVSTLSWFPYEHEPTKPMYEILEREGKKANRNHFGFDEVCINEQAQFTEYEGSKGGHYDWHMDSEIEMKNQPPVRKISAIVLLSDPKDFEGGGLEIDTPGKKIDLKYGHAVFFASFLRHRLLPVTAGIRHSLVVWLGGQPFR
jgi:PKHD-type hydroxylase